jgi:hypothetical protein
VTRVEAFSPHELLLAGLLAGAVEMAFFLLIVIAGENALKVRAVKEPEPPLMPIQVTPVLDELPLLKLGGKKVKTKLPDMWKKNPPVQRFQEASAPSPLAPKTPDAIPTSELVKPDAQAPPPDAEIAKKVDDVLNDAGPDAAPTVESEGAPDGVEEGTEADALKAQHISQYKQTLIRFFNRQFAQPKIPCEELEKLSTGVAMSWNDARVVTGFQITRPSGNAVFDAQVQSSMQNTVGQEVPAPPPLQADIKINNVSLSLKGRCQ